MANVHERFAQHGRSLRRDAHVDRSTCGRRSRRSGSHGPEPSTRPEPRDVRDEARRRTTRSATSRRRRSRRAEHRRTRHGNRFVIQKHAAERAGLHYDLRLERDGTLVSWAVRRGLPTVPGEKHFAAQDRGPPARVPRLRGVDPEGRVRRRRDAHLRPRDLRSARMGGRQDDDPAPRRARARRVPPRPDEAGLADLPVEAVADRSRRRR